MGYFGQRWNPRDQWQEIAVGETGRDHGAGDIESIVQYQLKVMVIDKDGHRDSISTRTTISCYVHYRVMPDEHHTFLLPYTSNNDSNTTTICQPP